MCINVSKKYSLNMDKTYLNVIFIDAWTITYYSADEKTEMCHFSSSQLKKRPLPNSLKRLLPNIFGFTEKLNARNGFNITDMFF